MTIFIGTDHNGFRFKQEVIAYLKTLQVNVVDCGDDTLDMNDDFPIFAARVCCAVLSSHEEESRGLLICGSGQGMIMAANRFKGIRAGLGYSIDAVKSIRNDEDSNVLSLPSSVFDNGNWQPIIRVWIKTEFANAERYRRRNHELDLVATTDVD